MKIDKMVTHWLKLVVQQGAARTPAGAYILIGDGIKIAKQAKFMPGVKKLHQESGNSSKAPCIFGHHFGVLGLLVGNRDKAFCVPVMAELHEGTEALRQLQGKDLDKEVAGKITVVSLMTNLIKDVAGKLKEPCVAVLDAYFAMGSAFAIARTLLNNKGDRLLHIVTRAKSNIVTREERPQVYGGRGRPRQFGKRIKLDELFKTRADDFSTFTVNTYGETRRLEILCLDLVWQAIREKLRFVLVKDDTSTFMLICSDLNMSPEEIVELYA